MESTTEDNGKDNERERKRATKPTDEKQNNNTIDRNKWLTKGKKE